MKEREAEWAMRFEVFHALRDLDQKTPEYFVMEMFAHAETTVMRQARAALTSLDPDARSNRVLASILAITGRKQHPG